MLLSFSSCDSPDLGFSIGNNLQIYFPHADGYAHSIMISAFCRAKLFRDAKQLAKDFETTSNKYDLVILNSMLCAFCRVGEMESVMETLKKMDELAIIPGYNTFHVLIKYFCREKMYLLAYQTMKDMHTKGHQPAEVWYFIQVLILIRRPLYD